MDPTVDLFCARHLVTSLYVTPEQIREGFEIQRAIRRDGGSAEPLVDVLLAKGYLDLDQAQEVRDAVAAAQGAGRLKGLPDGDEAAEAEASASTGDGVPPGLTIPGVALQARLGTSVAGVDFLGHHPTTGGAVCAHVLFPRWSRDVDARDQFLDSARRWQRVRHEFLAPVLDAGEAGARVYAVHALPDAPTLREVLDDGRLDVARAIAVGRGVAEALAAAHHGGCVHGALRPDEVFVLDTDAVQVRGCPRPTAGADVRTPHEAVYLPPEWDAESAPAPGGDLYALGVMLMEGLTGRSPLDIRDDETPEDVIERAARGLPRLRELRGDVDPAFATLVDWMTAPDPAVRPETADQVVTAFGMLSMGVAPPVEDDVRRAPSRRQPAQRRARPQRQAPAPRTPARRPRPGRSAASGRPAARGAGRPAARAGGGGGGTNPMLWVAMGGGGLLFLIVVALVLGSGGSPKRPDKRGSRTARNTPSKTRTHEPGFDPTPTRTSTPDPPRTASPAPAPAPKPAPAPAPSPDQAAARESEARDFLDRARRASAKGEFASAWKMCDYLDQNYADTRFYSANRAEIARLKSDAEANGGAQPPAGAGAGAGSLANAFVVVDGDAGDWRADWVEKPNNVHELRGVIASAKRGKGIEGHSAYVAPDYDVADCTIEATVTVRGDGAGGGAALTFRFDQSRPSLYEFAVRNGIAAFYQATSGGTRELARGNAGVPAEGTFRIGLVVQGTTFDGYVNGRKVLTITDGQVPKGLLGFGKYGASEVEFTDIRVERSAMPIQATPGAAPGPVPAPAPAPAPGPMPAPAPVAGGGTPAPGSWKPADGGSWGWVGDGIAQGGGEGFGAHGHAAWLDVESGGANFTMQCSVKLLPSDGGAFAGVAVRSDGVANGVEFYLYNVDGNVGWRLARFEGEKWSKIDSGELKVDLNVWYKLKVQVDGTTVRCYVDDRRVYEGTVKLPDTGACGLAKYGKTVAQWRNLRLPIK